MGERDSVDDLWCRAQWCSEGTERTKLSQQAKTLSERVREYLNVEAASETIPLIARVHKSANHTIRTDCENCVNI